MRKRYSKILDIDGEIYVHLDHVKKLSPNKIMELAERQEEVRLNFINEIKSVHDEWDIKKEVDKLISETFQ